jgi:rhodanese-related sulfurtransferase
MHLQRLLVALLVLTAITPLRSWEYRIDGDTVSGLLLVRPDNASAWGTVCDDGFTIADALVACRSAITTLRLVRAMWAPTGTSLPDAYPIWMTDVACSGTEAALSSCAFAESTTGCIHAKDVAITCATRPDGLELRLSEGTKGLLEMRPNVSAPWGTVCDHNFNATAAEAVCRELNAQYAYTAVALSGLASITGGPIYRSDVQCSNASNLFSGCNYTNSTSNCTNNTNAGVVCSDWAFRLDSSVKGLTGRLLARPTNASSWGTICATGFTQAAAMVACRTVIHPGYTLRNASVIAAGITANYTGLPVWMTNVNCANPSSTNLAACSWTDGANCSHPNDAWLQCGVDNSLFRLSSGSSGMVQVRPNATAPWGTVCGVGFDSNDAAAVCRELGYPAPQYIASAYNSSSTNGTTMLPTYYSGVRCNATQLFTTCAFDNNTAAMPPACQGGNHTSAASVRCTAAPSVWEYRLTNNNTGRLLVRPNAWSTWGTVCNYAFEDVDAAVACRSLFPRDFITSTAFTYAANASGFEGWPVYMNYVRCLGTEQQLASCWYDGFVDYGISHYHDLLLTCNLDQSLLRMSSGFFGPVQVRLSPTSTWSVICGVGFDSNDAAAVCRELGYPAPQYIASAYNSSSTNGTTMLPTYYSGVRCNATQLFTTCAFDNNTAAMPPACQGANHTSVASVRCTAAPSVWEYALTNNNTGRLLVRPNAWSAWGTVCNTSFDAVDAAVACRSVFPDAAIVSATFSSAGTWGYLGWPVYVNDLQCTGSELRLDSCRQSNNRCDHPNDVLLTCVINSMLRLSNMNASGIVQIRPNAAVAWGTVCGIGFDSNDAMAVCRELGYVAPRYIAVTSNGTAVGPTYYSAVRCNETQLFTSCTFTGNATLPAACTSASHAIAARVECREQPNVWEYRLASNTTSGRLQLRPNAWSPWGRLCSVINNASAWVACRSVFPGRLITSAAYVRAEPPIDLSGMPFYTSIIQCAGWEPQLSSCNSYGSSWDVRPFDTCWANVGDVVLTCGVPSVFYQLSNVTSGVIQVRPNITAPWGTVCGVGFDSNDAAAVCRELGYSAPQYIVSAYNSSSTNGTTMLPTYYSGVRCNATQLFTTCAFDNNTAAMPPACQGGNHTSAASVRCTAAPSVWEYALHNPSINGTFLNGAYTYQGLLIVRPNSWSAWGTVCDDGFGSSDAMVACRSVFPGRTIIAASSRAAGWYTSYPKLMDHVECAGTEQRLDTCRYTGNNNCSREGVILQCVISREDAFSYRLVNGSSGMVQVRPNATAPWGTVCGVGFDSNDAAAVCRELGYPAPQYIASAYNSSSTNGTTMLPTYYSGVRCNATQLFTTCAFDNNTAAMPPACQGGNHTSAASVRCTAAPSVWEYALHNPSINGTFLNGAYTYQGLLIVRPNSWSAWGTVCDDGFGSSDAMVACRSVFPGRTIIATLYRAAGSSLGYTSYSILMDDVECAGTEQRLDTCRYTGNNNCWHEEDVILQCVILRQSAFSYRLNNASGLGPITARRGLVELRSNSSAPWTAVCDEGFDQNAALVACQSIGYFGAINPVWLSPRTTNTTPPGATNATANRTYVSVHCTGTATFLEDCSHTQHSAGCTASNEVTIDCNVWEARLTFGTIGRLELRPMNTNAAWSAVCAEGFDARDAAAACATMFPNASMASVVADNGSVPPATAPIVWSGVSCPAPSFTPWTGASLAACAADMVPRCSNRAGVIVSCQMEQAPLGSWTARLGNLTGPSRGVLELRPPTGYTEFMRICDDRTFGAREAGAMCRALGIAAPSSVSVFSVEDPIASTSAPSVYLRNVHCANLNPTSCTSGASFSCPSRRTVGIDCGGESPGSSYSGSMRWALWPAASGGAAYNYGFYNTSADSGRIQYYALCVESEYALNVYAATELCRLSDISGLRETVVGIPRLNVPAAADVYATGGNTSGLMFATSMQCSPSTFGGCQFRKQPLANSSTTCIWPAVQCLNARSPEAASWQVVIQRNVLYSVFYPTATPVPLCGTTIDWHVAMVAARAVSPGTSDVFIKRYFIPTGFDERPNLVQYRCGEEADPTVPATFAACAVSSLVAAYCNEAVAVYWEGVQWRFVAGGAAAPGGVFVLASAYPWEAPSSVGLLSGDAYDITDATLEVACRSIGQHSNFYQRQGYKVQRAQEQEVRLVLWKCANSATASLSRCTYYQDNGTHNVGNTCADAVLAVDCRVMPRWVSIVVPVVSAVIGLIIVIIIVFCCVRRHRRLAKARGRLPTPEDVAPADLVTTEMTALGQLSGEFVVGAVAAGDGAAEHAFDHQGAASPTLLQGEAVPEGAPAEAALTPPCHRHDAVVIDSEEPRDPQPAVLEGRVVPVETGTATNSAMASADTPSMARLFQERRRWHAVLRGHAAPTTEPFSFTLLREMTQNFGRRLATPAEALPAGASVAFLNCADVSHGMIHSCTAAVSAVPSGELADVTRGFASAAVRPTAAGSACLPVLYGFAVAQEGVRALSQDLGMPTPPSGWTLVALLYEASPAASSCAAVCSSSHVDEAVTRRAIGWVARSVHMLSTHRILAAAHPHCVSFCGGTALGAPFPTRLWITTRYAVQPGNVLALLVSGLQAWQVLTAMPVLPKAAPAALDTLVGQLEAMGDMHYDWIRQYPFDPDAPCAFDAHFACSACGSVVIPAGLRMALLRCTALQGHYLCASCIIPAASGGNQRMRCPAVEGCSGDLVPSDVAVVQRRHRQHTDHTADSTAAATYSPPELELATAVDAPPPEELSFGGAAVVVVSPDDVDVEPLDADTSVPFLATHCPLDEPEAAADPPPEC